jgi:ubiquinone biosynthesis protein
VFGPSAAAWDRAHARTGRAIYRLATRLGGALVKLGQVLGARADFFPAAFVEPLKALHDEVPPRPFDELRPFVESRLGKPIDEVFSTVDETALAAASLAQVHRARLHNGSDVVIKIQYPEARKLFPIDMGSMRRSVRVVRWLNRKLDLRQLADELVEFVTLELEFDREAVSTERVRAAFDGDDRVIVPRVHAELSGNELLVLEFIEGIPTSREQALRDAGHDLTEVAEAVARIYTTMIFEHGFFHGDPHPGNLLVRADGAIGLLDFGLAKELPDGFAAGVATMIVKAMKGDAAGALHSAESIGFVTKTRDAEQFLPLIKMLLGDYGGPQSVLDAFKANSFEKIPSHFTLIVRAMVLLNGLSHRLVPGKRIIPMAVTRALAPHVIAAA